MSLSTPSTHPSIYPHHRHLSRPVHQVTSCKAPGRATPSAVVGGTKTRLTYAQQILYRNLGDLGNRQFPLAPVRPAHDITDRQPAPGCRHGRAVGVVLPVQILGLHRGERGGVLQGEVSDGGQVVAAAVRS